MGGSTDRQGWPSHKPACASCSFPKDDGEYLPVHGMNECNGVEFYVRAFLTTTLDWDEWLTSGSDMCPPSLSRETSPVPVEKQAVYILELPYTVWREEKVNQSRYRPNGVQRVPGI